MISELCCICKGLKSRSAFFTLTGKNGFPLPDVLSTFLFKKKNSRICSQVENVTSRNSSAFIGWMKFLMAPWQGEEATHVAPLFYRTSSLAINFTHIYN